MANPFSAFDMGSAPKKDEDFYNVAYNPISTQNNAVVISFCRSAIAAISGTTAGILGLTGLLGFVFYVVASGFMSLLLMIKAGKNWNNFFLTRSPLLTHGIFSELTTYILFWTFIYGMVHVY